MPFWQVVVEKMLWRLLFNRWYQSFIF